MASKPKLNHGSKAKQEIWAMVYLARVYSTWESIITKIIDDHRPAGLRTENISGQDVIVQQNKVHF